MQNEKVDWVKFLDSDEVRREARESMESAGIFISERLHFGSRMLYASFGSSEIIRVYPDAEGEEGVLKIYRQALDFMQKMRF